MKQRQIKFRYWNGISKMMVLNPKMPYKEGWTIKQLFEDRGWHWMQFTGLLDKNGKEIYEGDILKSTYLGGNIERIIWENGGFKVLWGKNSWERLYGDFVKNSEIIGNIYENPELLQ